MSVAARIAAVTGVAPIHLAPLAGGCVGDVYRVEFADRAPLVAKVPRDGDATLDVEAGMLAYLAPHLPVPAVEHAAPDLLLMEFVAGGNRLTGAVEEHAAELLARLHGVTAPEFGFERDTVIGGLRQSNPRSARWLPFFAEHRLVAMAADAHASGRLPGATRTRVEALAGDLGRFLDEPAAPALLHGDVWSGNVLARDGRVAAFRDPAIYFGHPEAELAFIAMFQTFGARFFAAYDAIRGIEPGFAPDRRDLYSLYPYLVHVRLFGGGYVSAVHRILARYGF